MRNLFFIILILCTINSFSQFTDNFSDGDITNNPIWIGNTDSFIVNPNTELQLNANLAGTSYISTASTTINNTEWRFKVDLNFSPSVNNTVSIFLVSDIADVSNNPNGYYIKIGENLSEDGIDLYKTGSTPTKIIDGTAGIAASGGLFNIKVIRDNLGNWEIFADDTGGENFISQGAGFDNSFTNSSYFGVLLKYTSSNISNIKFDDIYVGNIIVDTIPPILTDISVLNDTSILLSFSESITQASAENTSNYQIVAYNEPESAILQANLHDVSLHFNEEFYSLMQYNISIYNIEDLIGNIASQIDTSFSYIKILPNHIVINEIMADPNPSVGIAETEEWIEIYNIKNYPLELSGWKLKVGSNMKILPDFTIQGNSYTVICDDDSLNYFQNFGETIGIASFPLLTNSGATISLLDNNDQIISTVSYTDNWYQDEEKKNGGYTLEKIDPLNNCSGMLNWIASNASVGGTPSTENSVMANNIDALAPSVISFANDGINKLYIKLSEEVDTSINNILNYIINPNSITSITTSNNNTYLEITLSDTLISETSYTLNIQNLSDNCGNILNDTTLNFTHYNTQKFDIVINEIMFDPSPVVYLPEVEFVELFNRTNFDITLHNWIFNYGNYNSIIPDIVISANSFLILCQTSNIADLEPYGNTVGLDGFSLSNNNQLLSIDNNKAEIIHYVNYNADWISDDNKTEGGWSLEQVDPNTPCSMQDNWDVSTSDDGGTPGKENSIFANNQDLYQPEIIRAIISDSNKVILYFIETIVIDTITADYFTVDNGIGNSIFINSYSSDNTSIELSFNTNFANYTIYKLTFNNAISDCAGNNIDISSSVNFAYAEQISPNDIVINEVLYNPINDGVDYVEIYNRSNKVIDLIDLKIANKEDGLVDNIKNIATENHTIFPQEYILISKSQNKVKQQYITKTKYNFIDIETLPTYSNDYGTVVLVDRANIIIDEFEYTEEMQFPLLVSSDGVSLERLNPNAPTNKQNNWHSAAETVGFGTPAYQNSQYNPEAQGGGSMKIPNEVFSPDNDGLEDNLTIFYNFDKPGYAGSLYIFDTSGKLMIKLIDNELLAVEGSFIWNGIDQYNQKVNIGIYVIVLEVFDTEGNLTRYKDKCVVATKL